MRFEDGVALLGFKFFRHTSDDEAEIVRVMRVDNSNSGEATITIENEANKATTITDVESFTSSYTCLKSDGVISATVVSMQKDKDTYYDDVIVTAWTGEDLAMGYPVSLVCRQGVTDFLYDMIGGKENHGYVGICISRNDTPSDMNYAALMQCDKVTQMYTMHYYRNDTLEDILKVLGSRNVNKINKVMEKMFQEYIENISGIDMGQSHTKGHCRDLKTLLEINNFAYQLDCINNILPLKNKIEDYIEECEDGTVKYNVLNSDMRERLSYLYQKKISKIVIIEYDHDIELNKLNQSSTLLLRSSTGKLFVCHIVSDGEYLVSDLDKERLSSYTNDIRILSKYASKS